MEELTIVNGQLTLRNGLLTVRSRDIARSKPTAPEEKTSPDAMQEKPVPKTAAERQKELYERRKADGWRKIWTDPKTIALADELGGVEHISENRAALLTRIAELEAMIALPRKRKWWFQWVR